MGTLVCGVEDSPEAAEALRVATRLSGEAGLRLVVVRVERAMGPGPAFRTRAQQRGRQRLDQLLAAHAQARGAETRVEVGRPAEELARVAAEEAATVILVGSPSHRVWSTRRPSRLAADLAATAACPVVIVPAPPAR